MAQMDEVHCFRSLCAHWGSWESERRVPARRVVAPLSHRERNPYLEEDSLPTLSVVNVSEWASGTEVPNVSLVPGTTDSVSMVTEAAGLPRTQPPLRLPLQREGGVASTSVRPVQTSAPESVSGPLSPLQGSLGQRLLKLGTGQISRVPGLSSGRTLTWVPSRNYVPQNLDRGKPPRVSIKELTWFPPAELNPSIKKKSKQEEKRKKTVCFQERKEERLVFTGSGSDVDPGRPRPEDTPSSCVSSSPLRGHHLLLPPVSRTVVSDLRVKDGLRPPGAAVFHATQETVWSGPRLRDQPDYQYRLDPVFNMEGVDWDSLKRQTYLWRKRRRWPLPPAGPAQEWWLSLGHRFASGLRPIAKEGPSSHLESPLSTAGPSKQRDGHRILACESRPYSFTHTNHAPHMLTEDPVHSERMVNSPSLPRPPCGILRATLPRKPRARSRSRQVVKFAEMHNWHEIPSEVTLPPPPPCSLASDKCTPPIQTTPNKPSQSPH